MALAILDLLDVGDAHARFRADTGTNRYFRLRLGHDVREAAGFDWIDALCTKRRCRSIRRAEACWIPPP